MAVTQLVVGLELVDKLHVLEWASLLKNLNPVSNGLAVLLLDGWKVGSRTFDRYLSRHFDSFKSLLREKGACRVIGSTATTIKGTHFGQSHASIFTELARADA